LIFPAGGAAVALVRLTRARNSSNQRSTTIN
jgi:hypothetical protein